MAQNLEHIIWGLSQNCNLERGLQVCHIRLIFSEIYIKDGIKNKILLKIIVSISKTFKTSIFDLASSTRIVSHDGKIYELITLGNHSKLKMGNVLIPLGWVFSSIKMTQYELWKEQNPTYLNSYFIKCSFSNSYIRKV